jgi:hypothetical protein
METDKTSGQGKNYKVWFFAGAETRDDRFNTFTGSFIRFMKEILEEDFEYIKGVYYNSNMVNVIWALNNAQRPIQEPEKNRIIVAALNQMISNSNNNDVQLVITSSSAGTILAAQAACYLAMVNRNRNYFSKPFHLVLGASMIATESELYRQLLHYQKEGTIGTIIHDEIQDDDDNSRGVGGVSRFEAYRNALGIVFPVLSRRYNGPSFLNTHPEKGHIHRKRSMTVQKALDYIDIILVRYKLAGQYYMVKAEALLKEKTNKE